MIKPESIVFFIAIMFPCYVINLCIEDNPVGFFVGIVCGVLITKAFPLVKQRYQQQSAAFRSLFPYLPIR